MSAFIFSSDEFKSWMQVQRIGCSFEDRPIHGFRWGSGSTKILFWGTTNGLDKTSLEGLLDFMRLLAGKEPEVVSFGTLIKWKAQYSLYFIPVLNPDGIHRALPANAMGIDIYKDARSLIAPESQVLDATLKAFVPDIVIGLENVIKSDLHSVNLQEKLLLLEIAPSTTEAIKSSTFLQNQYKKQLVSFGNKLSLEMNSCVGIVHNDYCQHHFGSHLQLKGIASLLIRPVKEIVDSNDNKTRILLEKSLIYLLNHLNSDISKANIAASDSAEAISKAAIEVDVLYKKAKITASNGKRFIADVALKKRSSGFELKEIGDLEGLSAKEIVFNQVVKLDDLQFANN